ncbi:hypothetical protein C0431_06915 [bacterium]|nr:hypothetical protein [bacterium]
MKHFILTAFSLLLSSTTLAGTYLVTGYSGSTTYEYSAPDGAFGRSTTHSVPFAGTAQVLFNAGILLDTVDGGHGDIPYSYRSKANHTVTAHLKYIPAVNGARPGSNILVSAKSRQRYGVSTFTASNHMFYLAPHSAESYGHVTSGTSGIYPGHIVDFLFSTPADWYNYPASGGGETDGDYTLGGSWVSGASIANQTVNFTLVNGEYIASVSWQFSDEFRGYHPNQTNTTDVATVDLNGAANGWMISELIAKVQSQLRVTQIGGTTISGW